MVVRDDFDKSHLQMKDWKRDVYEDVQRFIQESVSSINNFKTDNSE